MELSVQAKRLTMSLEYKAAKPAAGKANPAHVPFAFIDL
jgi:hypothetical protein